MDSIKFLKETKKEFISVGYFYENCQKLFKMELISKNRGFNRKISDKNIHRPGLALAGYVELFTYNRVQIFGNTEISYLNGLSKVKRIKTLERFFSFDIPCLIITNGSPACDEILQIARKRNISILRSNNTTTKTVYEISDFLDDQFSVRANIHGSFVDVYGIGLLFVGDSGIGKSEVVLDLVERGHRLVADDVVIVTRKGEGILIGSATKLSKHFMELRGVGIINVQKIFGVRSIRYQKRIEVIIILEHFNKDSEYTRTGLDIITTKILSEDIPTVRLPIIPGKNITVIAEVIALNYLLNHYGYNAANDIQTKIIEAQKVRSIKGYNSEDLRAINYFEHDFE